MDILLNALLHHALPVLGHDGQRVDLAQGYQIELEANGLYKLRHRGQVVAPFDDVEELCRFIAMDMALGS